MEKTVATNRHTTPDTQLNGGVVRRFFFSAIVAAALFFAFPFSAHAASLTFSPSSGTFTVGSTFSITVLLNTEDETANTIRAQISYPADKLQLVSPSTGNSVISIWTSLPKVDNQRGIVDLQGGIPGGIKSTGAAITTLVFRVNSVGNAVVRFTDQSKVLLNNGLGTEALRQVTNGVYNLVLPPPAGPIVSSETHPDQTNWYNISTVVLRWAPEQNVDGYSYMLSENPGDVPDDISEGINQSVTYKNVPDGIHYFHIKSLKDKAWGGVTHFALKIDTAAPAAFPVDIIPDARTSRREPIVQFSTTDGLSSVSHYELKLIPLSPSADGGFNAQPLFIEVTSPYVFSELPIGNYDVIVRAYDFAGNYQEITERMSIVNPVFTVVRGEGVKIGSALTIPWYVFWILMATGILAIGLIFWRIRSWRHRIIAQRANRELPQKLQQDLDELKRFRARYGKLAACLLIIAFVALARPARADVVQVTPPIVDTISRNITNEDIFYIGGKTDTGGSSVIIYLQNLSTGETLTEVVPVDNRGNWFYRHGSFLSSGEYLLWTQNKIGNEISPPSPQEKLKVSTSVVHLGTSRISVETINGAVAAVALLGFLILLFYTLYHARHVHRERKALLTEIRTAEESVRRGFAVIRRDIQAELELVHKVKLEKNLSDDERTREEQLLKDLEAIEQNIGKEIWEIDHLEAQLR